MGHRISPKAEIDLDNIWYFVAKQSGNIEIANRLVDSISDQFSLIGRHPYLGRSRDDDFGIGTRSLAVGDYIIVYCVEDADALILRVVHGRRDLDFLLDE